MYQIHVCFVIYELPSFLFPPRYFDFVLMLNETLSVDALIWVFNYNTVDKIYL